MRLHVRYCRVVVGISAACLISINSGSVLKAQSTTDSLDKKIVGACWTSESTRDLPGKCPSQVKDQAMLCLNESMGGGIGGNYHTSRMSTLRVDKVAMEDLTRCDAVGDIKMVDYDVSLSKSPKDVLLLNETHHKCGLGSCADVDKNPLKGTLAFDGEVLVFSRSDGVKLRFNKYQAPDSKEVAK